MFQKKKSNGLDYSIFQGSSFPPQKTESDNNNTQLRLVTLNMAHGNAGPQYQFPRGCSGANINHHDVRRHLIETELLEMRPDVICVQESVIQSSDWGYRNQNTAASSSSSALLLSTVAASLSSSSSSSKLRVSSSQTKSSTTTSVVSKMIETHDALLKAAEEYYDEKSKQSTTTITTNKNQLETENSSSSLPLPQYKRTKEVAITHCGMTFMYVNTSTFDILIESRIAALKGSPSCPQFPVVAVSAKKKNRNQHDDDESTTEKTVFMICSIHLAPFPMPVYHKTRKLQFSHVVSEMNRLEKEWFFSRKEGNTKKYKIVKIIAGDTNMINEQFPAFTPDPKQQVLDCWYEHNFGTQVPSGNFFATNPVPYFLPDHTIPKFFIDSYTFGGDNDYNYSSLKELRRFQI
jgi:hypothetical protein